MTRRQNRPSGSEPELMRLALGYAEHTMRNIGRVPPTLLAETDDGILLYLPEKMGNERAKDDFANTLRLVAAGYRASAVAMVLESWATFAKPGRPLDKKTPPSQSPDREEIVMVSVETRDQNCSKILLIQRKQAGEFAGFGTPPMPDAHELQGRFAGILPPKPPNESDATMARQVLTLMGVVQENQGFDPRWN